MGKRQDKIHVPIILNILVHTRTTCTELHSSNQCFNRNSAIKSLILQNVVTILTTPWQARCQFLKFAVTHTIYNSHFEDISKSCQKTKVFFQECAMTILCCRSLAAIFLFISFFRIPGRIILIFLKLYRSNMFISITHETILKQQKI